MHIYEDLKFFDSCPNQRHIHNGNEKLLARLDSPSAWLVTETAPHKGKGMLVSELFLSALDSKRTLYQAKGTLTTVQT